MPFERMSSTASTGTSTVSIGEAYRITVLPIPFERILSTPEMTEYSLSWASNSAITVPALQYVAIVVHITCPRSSLLSSKLYPSLLSLSSKLYTKPILKDSVPRK
jgi:hypothetical protein